MARGYFCVPVLAHQETKIGGEANEGMGRVNQDTYQAIYHRLGLPGIRHMYPDRCRSPGIARGFGERRHHRIFWGTGNQEAKGKMKWLAAMEELLAKGVQQLIDLIADFINSW